MTFETRLPLLALLLVSTLFAAGAQGNKARSCEVGVYRGAGGDFATITERDHTPESGEWRYTFRNGEFGSTKGGPVRCMAGAIEVSREDRAAERWPAEKRISKAAMSGWPP